MIARPVTLADIAREAGTSPATASRALSGRGYVSAEARERLLEAAERLGYVPNASARTLKQRHSRTVGVAVSDISNRFYARLASGIEQTLREAHYQTILLSDNSEGPEEIAGARTFLAMRSPGVILTPVSASAADLLLAHGTPVVELDRRLATLPCDGVVIDNVGGARVAVEHLLEHGHRRIGLLVADTTWTTDAGRRQGYRLALAASGVAVDERLILPIPFAADDPAGTIAAWLDAQAPTAVFAANNTLAEAAWRVLRERGRRIPDDVSLVGFDDVPWMEMVDPGITVVAQPTVELGRRSAELLLRRIEEPGCPQAEECLAPTLVVRGSVAPLTDF
jgi:LacI family transcriptional regulator